LRTKKAPPSAHPVAGLKFPMRLGCGHPRQLAYLRQAKRGRRASAAAAEGFLTRIHELKPFSTSLERGAVRRRNPCAIRTPAVLLKDDLSRLLQRTWPAALLMLGVVATFCWMAFLAYRGLILISWAIQGIAPG
jgi:hypothetical protein